MDRVVRQQFKFSWRLAWWPLSKPTAVRILRQPHMVEAFARTLRAEHGDALSFSVEERDSVVSRWRPSDVLGGAR